MLIRDSPTVDLRDVVWEETVLASACFIVQCSVEEGRCWVAVIFFACFLAPGLFRS